MNNKYQMFSSTFPIIILLITFAGIALIVNEARTEMASRKVSLLAALRLVIRASTEYQAITATLAFLLIMTPIALYHNTEVDTCAVHLVMAFMGVYVLLSFTRWCRRKARKPYGVHVIVDPFFGERLREIPVGEPVWIVDSAVNRQAYEAVGRERKPEGCQDGMTLFKANKGNSPEDWLIAEIETIDLHHGGMSHTPSWSLINVIGTKWSHRIQIELKRFGFDQHEETVEGFSARKERMSTTGGLK